MTCELSISVVLYKNPPLEVEAFLDRVFQSQVDALVFLIDNSPTDLLSYFGQWPRVFYHKTEENLGFGAGHNIAIFHPQNTASFHLIANADVSFGPQILPGMLDFLKTNADVSAINPKVRYPNGKLQHLRKFLPKPIDLFLRRFFPGFLKFTVKKRLNHFEMQHFSADKITWVPALSGCFMMCRSQALIDVEGFDEHFFLYLEDYDLSRRLNRHGKTLYVPQFCIEHRHSRASYNFGKALRHHLRSAAYYFGKHGWRTDVQRDDLNARAAMFNQQQNT